RVLREWVRAQGIATFYDAGEGVCHQIMVEEGYCEPGTVIVGSDSHSNSYGAVGAFGAGMGATDIAVALALGRTWLRVPESIKVTFTGTLRKGITMKDAIMRVVREIGTDGAHYACVEFHGVCDLPQGDRITLAGMTTEMGAKAGLVVGTPEAPDWLFPARGATYGDEVTIDVPTRERGGGDWGLRVRSVARAHRRRAGGQRDLSLDGEPQLQRPHGLAGRRDLHRVAVRRGRRRAHRRHRRPASLPGGVGRRARLARRAPPRGAAGSRRGVGALGRPLPRARPCRRPQRTGRGDRRFDATRLGL